MNIQLANILDKEESSDKKEAIFQSTLSLIHDYGFHGSPMSRIAEQAQVAIGSIYHYFSSKDALIIELFFYTKEQTEQAMYKGDNEQLDYQTRFFNIWNNLVLHYIERPAVLSFLHQFYSSPYAKMVLAKESFCLQDEVSAFLQVGIDNKHIKNLDINIISAAFIGTVVATARQHTNQTINFDNKRLKDMAGIIWDGIKIGSN